MGLLSLPKVINATYYDVLALIEEVNFSAADKKLSTLKSQVSAFLRSPDGLDGKNNKFGMHSKNFSKSGISYILSRTHSKRQVNRAGEYLRPIEFNKAYKLVLH